MDERYDLKGISFIWDLNKAQANLAKHGVAFSQAAQAFFDHFFALPMQVLTLKLVML